MIPFWISPVPASTASTPAAQRGPHGHTGERAVGEVRGTEGVERAADAELDWLGLFALALRLCGGDGDGGSGGAGGGGGGRIVVSELAEGGEVGASS
jgi:hypothetical protein